MDYLSSLSCRLSICVTLVRTRSLCGAGGLRPSPASPTLYRNIVNYSTLSYTTPNSPTIGYTLLHYAILSYTTQYSPTLLQTLRHYATLSYTTPYSPTLLSTLLHYSNFLSYTTPHSRTLLHTLVHYAITIMKRHEATRANKTSMRQETNPRLTVKTYLLNTCSTAR